MKKITEKHAPDKCLKKHVLNNKNESVSISSALKIASVFAGAILGAGFAGGRELVTFFVRFGKSGVLASILAGIMFLITGTAIIHKANTSHSTSYKEYLKKILPEKISYLLGAISEIFLLICFVIMLSFHLMLSICHY